MGNVAVKVDCTECGGTGYDNLWTEVTLPAYYTPGPVKRWNPVAGGVTYFGNCLIKLNAQYRAAFDNCDYVEMDGVQYDFVFMENPGEGMGQKRLVIALSRKD
jgi:hypothetical protein